MPLKEWELEALEERVRTEMGSNSGAQMKSVREELIRLRRAAETVRLPHLDRKLLHEFTRELTRAAADETDIATRLVQAEVLRVLCRVLEAQGELQAEPASCSAN